MITKALINNEARKWGITPERLARLWLGKHRPVKKRRLLLAAPPANVIYLPARPIT